MTFINTSTGAISLRDWEAAQLRHLLPGLTEWKERTDSCELPSDLHTYVGVCDCPPLTTPTDGDDGAGAGAAAKCNKYNSLSLQKETKHWPGYLRSMAFQEHSDDDVHPSEAGPQALESSSTNHDII